MDRQREKEREKDDGKEENNINSKGKDSISSREMKEAQKDCEQEKGEIDKTEKKGWRRRRKRKMKVMLERGKILNEEKKESYKQPKERRKWR